MNLAGMTRGGRPDNSADAVPNLNLTVLTTIDSGGGALVKEVINIQHPATTSSAHICDKTARDTCAFAHIMDALGRVDLNRIEQTQKRP